MVRLASSDKWEAPLERCSSYRYSVKRGKWKQEPTWRVGYLNEVQLRPLFSKSLDLQISSLVDYFKKINAFLFHERYQPSWIICIKGLVYLLSHDCHFDIDRDVSSTNCRSLSGDSVDLPSRTFLLSPWLLVIGVSRTSLRVDGFRSKALLVFSKDSDWLLCCLIVGIHPSLISSLCPIPSTNFHDKSW